MLSPNSIERKQRTKQQQQQQWPPVPQNRSAGFIRHNHLSLSELALCLSWARSKPSRAAVPCIWPLYYAVVLFVFGGQEEREREREREKTVDSSEEAAHDSQVLRETITNPFLVARSLAFNDLER